VGIGLATLNVFFRDVVQIVTVGLQVLFWGSPILWRSEFIAEKAPAVLPWLKLNPLYCFLEFFHNVFAESPTPFGGRQFLIILGWTAGAVIFGSFVYRKLRDEIVDEL
jgi:ABC-type polysaccharide/polyol phosphate export permease